ncbi:MAG: hypothetical protein HN389_12880, partial [Clostridia bacterium]|nr:hypothetical protein [Clostridia bacterium]
TAWFDCFQLEDGPIANRYNIIDNADFDYVTNGIPDKWTRNSNCTSSDIVVTTADSENPEYMSDNRFEFIGSPSQNKYIEQDFDLSGEEGDSYVVGGWAKGNSIPVFGTIKYGIAIRFNYIGYTDEWVLLPFSQDSDVWQYMCGAVVAKHDYSDVYIRVEINYNANAVNFDGLHMFKEEYGSTFTYDSDGNLTKVTDSAQQDEEFEYNANDDLTKYIDPAGNEFDYTYDDNHNMLTATSEEGLVYTYEYDDVNENGNVVASKVGNETNYIRAEVAYDASGNFTDCVTDPFGEVMDYTYDIYKGTLTSVTDPLSNTVSNTYDSNTDQLEGTSMTSGSVTVSNGYDYTDYRLTDVSHNAPTGDVDYTIHYNDLGWNTGVSVETTRLVTNNLEDQTGRLNSVAYGNSQTVSYTYDDFDRLIKIYQDTTDLYSYIYDNSGNIGYMKDHVLGVEYWYEYDSLFRLGRITRKDSAGTKTTTEYTFNSANMMSAFVETVDGTTYTTSYAYDGDGRPDTSTFGTFSKDITYDATLGRVSGYVLKDGANTIYSTSVGYDDGDGTTSADSGRIDSITNGNATNGYETLSYNYDARGYITRVEEDANNYSEYQYDGFGQLKRENYKWGATSYTMIFAYDVGGNITSRIKYAFVAGADPVGTATATYNYTYDTTWQDELATYAGVTLTHDNIGNLTNDGTWDYTWTQGRRLEEITDDTTSAVIASYKYNDNGIRTEKTVDGDTTKFNLVGSQITWQQTGTEDPIYFLYDSGGKLWGLEYTDGETYFYVRNVQGDIIKIVDDNGDIMVEYAYDAWGNPSTPTGSKATTLGVDNPFRYRGYYFDEETGLYYLNQRYYNSEWGRFINADDVMGQTGALLTHNLFAYCQNNPVMYQDSNGQFFMLITGLIGAAVGAIVG